jgi:membrane protein required for colicin V production
MTWFDYAVLAIVGVSVLLSVLHGLTRELLALASWVVAFLAAKFFATVLAPLLPAAIKDPSLRLLAAYVIVFVIVLIAMTVLAVAISGLIRKAGLGIADRMLGAAFGFARGVAIALLGVMLAGLTAMPRQPAWRHAMLSAPLEMLANAAKVWLPYDLAKRINYD